VIEFMRGRRRHHDDHDDHPPLTKLDRQVRRLSNRGLDEWGSQVASHLAMLYEKPEGDPQKEEGEIAEATLALQAVHRERTARRSR
jgi:hypothetical protein